MTAHTYPQTSTRGILMVDDDPTYLAVAAAAVRRGGCPVTVADSAYAAIEYLRTDGYAVLVTDLQMPGMDGADLFIAAKILRPLIRGMVLSAFVDGETLLRLAGSGVHAVLCKQNLRLGELRDATLLQLLEYQRWVGLLDDVSQNAPVRSRTGVNLSHGQAP